MSADSSVTCDIASGPRSASAIARSLRSAKRKRDSAQPQEMDRGYSSLLVCELGLEFARPEYCDQAVGRHAENGCIAGYQVRPLAVYRIAGLVAVIQQLVIFRQLSRRDTEFGLDPVRSTEVDRFSPPIVHEFGHRIVRLPESDLL